MKHAIAWLAFMSLISPALASNKEDYKAAKEQWQSDWKDTRQNWNDAGRPDPRPSKPDKPNRNSF